MAIFKDLSRDELLNNCLHGKTQNVNEAYNQTLWTACAKNIYVRKDTLELGVSSAVLRCDDGPFGFSKAHHFWGFQKEAKQKN